LRDCIEEVLQLFIGQAARTGVELLYDIDPEVPEQIRGDRKRLNQVLVNLVENAVRHTETGEITISAGMLSQPEKDELELCFEVRDTGTGIAADKMEQLFKGIGVPEGADDVAGKPAGLGLIICKRLVESMRGFIQASSEAGEGSQFTFSIRVARSQQQARKTAAQQRTVFEGKRVLVVDGRAGRRAILVRRLEKLGLIPVAADSVRHALEILSRRPGTDAVVIDGEAGEIGPLVDAARKLGPGIPVLAIGGSAAADGLAGRPADGSNGSGPANGLAFDAVLARPVRQHLLSDQLLQLLTLPAGERVHSDAGKLLEDRFSGDHPLRILVAEDHPVNQKLAMTVLTKLGYTPDLAGNGKEALDMVSHQNYDIILMDVQMPEMDGLEATRMIRLCVQPQPVIIAMTANAMQGDRDRCLQAGMDDYISKPLELDELVAQLKKWSAVIREKIK
ncbi:MAG TPA: response regulator, partial [Puia sp.]|nr:response regulator [Puia sp.]